MRLVSLALIASLTLGPTSGCILAVPPAVGAGIGGLTAVTAPDHRVSAAVTRGVVGALVGVALDAVLIVITFRSLQFGPTD